MNADRNRLWLALRLRDLPLSALRAAVQPDEPVAVAEKRQVVFCNNPAKAAGVTPGMDLSTAQMLSGCRILPREQIREKKTLCDLRNALYRFTPHIDIHQSRYDYQSGLLLEVSTCLKLFSGLTNLCNAILGFFSRTDYDVRPGLAHTATGAWLLTFANHQVRGDETPELFVARLNELPVHVLYDHHDAVDALVKMGFSTLGDVARQIESSGVASFTKRLGKEFAVAIADIYNIDRNFAQASLFTKPVSTYTPDEYFQGNIQFDYPVTLVDQLKPAFENLLQSLSVFLLKRQQACQHIQWRISDIYRRSESVDVSSDIPQSSWQLLYDLTLITFEHKPIPFEVESLELICRDLLPCQPGNEQLNFTDEPRNRNSDRELAVTMTKLRVRLGDGAVHKVSYRDSLLPERSHTITGIAEKSMQQLPDVHKYGLRPSWLFSEPQHIEQRGKRLFWQGYLTLAVGPERLVGHWWEDSIARDYYLARRQDNVAVWVYQDLHSKQWYVHGVFS